jgi:hypothetical protein
MQSYAAHNSVGHVLFYAFLLLMAPIAFAAETTEAPSRALDGLEFVGETGEKGKGDHHADTISFEKGMFRSLDCEGYGFSSAPYSVVRNGDAFEFKATLFSEDLGRLEWSGTIKGKVATGTFRWKHKRWFWTIERNYWFKGTRR